jgi:Flp pilus assembly protein TadG
VTRGAPPPRRDRGSATVELAIALPALALVLAVLLAVGVAVVSQVRLAEAARAGAREAALGSSDSAVAVAARTVAGPDATTAVVRANGLVQVTVAVQLPLAGLPWPGGGRISAVAHAKCEPERGCL